MKLFSSRKVIAILLLVVAVGLFANLMVYWVLPVVKAQSACTAGEQITAIPLSAGGSPGAMPGVGFPGIHGGGGPFTPESGKTETRGYAITK